MDRDLLLIMIMIIVVVSVVANALKEVAKRGIALKERQLELRHTGTAAPAVSSEVTARLEQMEQRLRVLERIATDRTALPSADLAREIEALRLGNEEKAGSAV
jgi:hypothetical protein